MGLSSLLPYRILSTSHSLRRRPVVDSPPFETNSTCSEDEEPARATPTVRATAAASEEEEGVAHWLEDRVDDVVDEAERLWHLAVEKGRKGALLCYEELPHEWRGNQYILEGYRFISHDRAELYWSALKWHNETINVWSHFLGLLSIHYLALYHLPTRPSSPFSTLGSQVMIGLWLFLACKCMAASAIYHLLNGCSTKNVRKRATCLDFVGISGVIAASVLSAEFYGIICHPYLRIFYMTFTGIMGAIGMVVPWRPWFGQPEHRTWRINFFLLLVISSFAPILHLSFLHGPIRTLKWFFIPTLPSLVAYTTGLLFYAKQWPERALPGKCDHIGQSHNLWHVAIVAGLWLYWRAINMWAGAAVMGEDLTCLVG